MESQLSPSEGKGYKVTPIIQEIIFKKSYWRIPTVESAFDGIFEGVLTDEEKKQKIEQVLQEREKWEPSQKAWAQLEEVKTAIGKEVEVQIWDPIIFILEEEGPSPILAKCTGVTLISNEEGKQQAYLTLESVRSKSTPMGYDGRSKLKDGGEKGTFMLPLADIYSIRLGDINSKPENKKMSSPALSVKKQQRKWADTKGIGYDKSGYTHNLNDNLFRPMSTASISEFSKGDGGELGNPYKRGKIQALHSSSALACNVFDYWRGRDATILTKSLGLSAKNPTNIEFERKFPTGLRGNAPNLDVVITSENSSITAIESKFLEPYSNHHNGFKKKYFESSPGLWEKTNFHHCQKLAYFLQTGEITFKWLHAEQLLKHILGLSNSGLQWRLLYLWYEIPSRESYEHLSEIIKLSSFLEADRIHFKFMSYQTLFAAIQSYAGEIDRDYLSYLGERYFNEIA